MSDGLFSITSKTIMLRTVQGCETVTGSTVEQAEQSSCRNSGTKYIS
jgi:hypothetical protein